MASPFLVERKGSLIRVSGPGLDIMCRADAIHPDVPERIACRLALVMDCDDGTRIRIRATAGDPLVQREWEEA